MLIRRVLVGPNHRFLIQCSGIPASHRAVRHPFHRCNVVGRYFSMNKEENAEPTNPGMIYNPPTYDIPAPKEIKDCIRSSLVRSTIEKDTRRKDTEMSLIFLGTSAGLPSKSRNPTSTLLRLGGRSILVDAAEGTQRQLMFTCAKLAHIDMILITHLHGDHIFGLPGFLLGLQQAHQLQGRSDRVVKIYGPPGLYNYIAANVILSCTAFHSIHIEVIELVGGRVRRAHGAKDIRSPFEFNYPEFNYGKLIRRKLPCGHDGIWRIEDVPSKLTREDILTAKSSRSSMAGEKTRFRIQAAEVDHLSGVATFGYSIEEEDPPRNIDATKARELGVSPAGRKFNLLKAGFSVYTDDGSRQVQPVEVLTAQRKRARKITVVGDNRAWTAAMKSLARNSDILVHEATLIEKVPDWHKRGHSTAEMAGKISGEVNARLLVLNHIASKADFVVSDGQLSLIKEAKVASEDKSDVLVAYDFMEIVVPWLGFRSTEEESPSADACDSQTLNDFTKDRRSKNGLVDTKEVLTTWFGGETR